MGYSLARELSGNGIHIYAICRENSNNIARLTNLPNITIIKSDLSCAESITGLDDCSVFYHLAWDSSNGYDDFTQQYSNVGMTLNCLRLAASIGCKRFVCTGSQAEYGNVEGLITEETPLRPTTAYGACKVAAYYLVSALAKKLNIEYIWLRVFSVYGPNDRPSSLIMWLLREWFAGRDVKLRTNGNHIWNYLYEADAARALHLLGSAESAANRVYNLAGKQNRILRSYIMDMRKVIPSAPITHYGAERSQVNLDVSVYKLLSDIGEYESLGFEEGIAKILDACFKESKMKGGKYVI